MKATKRELLFFVIILILLVPFFIYSLSLSSSIDDGDDGYPVYITEILASNSLYPDENGVCCDWIELHNSSDSPVDISNFGLSDNQLSVRYTIPEGTFIEAGGYLVIRCSDQYGEGYAPFNISKSGEEDIVLTSATNVVLNCIRTVPTIANHPMILDRSGEWVVADYATPGFSNDETGRTAYIASLNLTEANLKITEVVPSNRTILPDMDGDFSDYIEITNFGDAPVSLAGFFLSDNTDDLLLMRLPDVTVEPGGCCVVFASAKDRPIESGEIHAPFSLRSEGETVTISYPTGEVIDSVVYPAMESDRAYLLAADGNLTISSEATPGYPNTDEGLLAFIASRPTPDGLVISEATTSNFSLMMQKDGNYYDWVELQNRSSASINLSQYYLSDSLDIKDKCHLPDVTLKPGEYFVLICSGNSELSTGKYTHANISLSAAEESLYLHNSSGQLTDYAHLINLTYGGSYGRMNDGSNGYYYFAKPTPGAENVNGQRTVTKTPFSTCSSGVYNDVDSLTIELLGGDNIRYTTDGTLPKASSTQYTEPIVINKTTVIRAACFSADAVTGSTATFSYIIGENHTLPVVSLAVDPDDLWSDEKGIYVKGNYNNYFKDWEKLAHISFFEENGSFSMDCGLKLHGAGTRETSAKKSFKVVFRPRYDGELKYKMFEDSPIDTFKSLLLRGGEDYTKTLFRDEVCRTLADDGSDSLLTLNDRYSVLYINGKYFGIFAIRESYSEEYCASHMDVSPDSVTIVRGPVYENRSATLLKLIDFARNNNMKNEDNYRYIEERIDLDSLIDWYIFEAYCGNNDIPGNVRYVYSTETGKWQYCFYDLDWAFVWTGTCKWAFADDTQHSVLFRALRKNDQFRDRFLKRANELFNGALSDDNILKTIDYYTELLRPEMEREREYWGGSVAGWEKSVAKMRGYVANNDRIGQFLNSLQNYMDLSDQDIKNYFGR